MTQAQVRKMHACPACKAKPGKHCISRFNTSGGTVLQNHINHPERAVLGVQETPRERKNRLARERRAVKKA